MYSSAMACRGCWMPGANEVLGCPRIFSIFLVVHQIYSNSSHKISIFSQFFPFFASVFKFQENSLLGCPPVLHHAPVTTFFLFLFSHLPTFLYENWPRGCPGPSHRPNPPLHATDIQPVYMAK